MTSATSERRRHLTTAGIGTALMIVMGAVLVMGFRLATHMRTDIMALQTASALQAYPEEISHQLNTLRDRLEIRAYEVAALKDLQETVKRFDQDLRQLGAAGNINSPELGRALLMWHEYEPALEPVVSFSDQPYVDSDTSGSALSPEGRQHYAAVKRAQLYAAESARPLRAQLVALATSLQKTASDAAARLRMLLLVGVLAALLLAAAAGEMPRREQRLSLGRERPDEYVPWGGLRYDEPSLRAEFGDGTRSVEWRVAGHRVTREGPVSTLDIDLADTAHPLGVTVSYRVYDGFDVLDRWATLRHSADKHGADKQGDGPPIVIRQAHSANWWLPSPMPGRSASSPR